MTEETISFYIRLTQSEAEQLENMIASHMDEYGNTEDNFEDLMDGDKEKRIVSQKIYEGIDEGRQRLKCNFGQKMSL